MTPRYQVIKQHILTEIQAGNWHQGTPVPSENQLASTFSVSRMTARRALSELTEAGVLERSQGSGTFVAGQLPTGAALEIKNIATEIAERQHRHRATVLNLEACFLDADMAKALLLPEGSPAFFSRIIHFENDLPIQLEERTVHPDRAPDYLLQDFTAVTPNQYLSEQIPLSEADHWIEAVLPQASQAQWLEIEPSQPCLKVSRRTYDPHQQVVNFAVFYHPGHRYRLGGHLNF